MIARIHDDGYPNIGSTLSLARLSMHLGLNIARICRHGKSITHRGETWEAELDERGRRRGYKLLSREQLGA